jgi:two-component system cell cycle sensor histidine kinase/response regulator CckA
MNVTQDLLESLPEPHCILSRDLALIAVNSAFLGLLQTSLEELVQRGMDTFWPSVAESCRSTTEHTTEFIDAKARSVSARITCQVSECIVVRVLASAAPGESIKQHHKQRIETLGIIAGGVAHDFNNVLTGILGHIAYLKHVLPQPNQGTESLAAIEEGALKAAGLTQQILNFSRLEASEQLTQVDVGSVLSAVAVLLKSAIPAQIVLNIVQPQASLQVLASEVNIAQILINLIINARDAISAAGEITVSLEGELDGEVAADYFRGEPAASHYGAIIVSDTGSGMSEQVKARLFEPYFTTKGGAGTGLGLATVNSIVRQLGGVVCVESELGTGTVFRVVLPSVVDGNESELCAGQQPDLRGDDHASQSGHGEKILIIDDEDAVRNVLGLSLAHLGYAVETASSGREGLEKFQQAQGEFGLVILDLLMPGLSGEDVFYRLREIRPELPVLIVSGFSSAHVVQRILDDGGRDFIQKPFSIEVLSEKVRWCLRD